MHLSLSVPSPSSQHCRGHLVHFVHVRPVNPWGRGCWPKGTGSGQARVPLQRAAGDKAAGARSSSAREPKRSRLGSGAGSRVWGGAG